MAVSLRSIERGLATTWRPLLTAAVLLALLEVLKQANMLPVFLPAPSQVLNEIVKSPRLVTDSLPPTAYKALSGFVIASAIAMIAGAIAVLARVLYGSIYNLGVILHSIPIIATAPLLALWLGTGPQLQIIITALACQFPVLVGTMQGLRAADERQRELMHVLSASRLQTLRILLLPGAVPYLFAGFKIAAPAAVLGAITAEWAGAERGIGAMMLYALFSYDTPKVWLSVLLTCTLALAGYGFVVLVERLAFYWGRDVQLAN
ncbi:MAG TPA: ABC transporter permease subunit [Pseudolabrys sp.]|nr:ABC transporter permease subunit [Pseudolabrys sp.]